MNNKTFYLTTTLPYVNAPLHMGHALEFVRADTIARYKKLQGFDVYFNTGTDEHGLKIFEKAKENNLSAQEFVNKGFEVFKDQLKMFGVIDDIHFIRTTDSKHEKAAQEFWIRVRENGYIYKKLYEAKYCVGCESEKTDSELVDGECPLHPGNEIKIINEENYFFKYSKFGEKLLDFYHKNPDFVIPEFRYNEIIKFVENGLQDFSISRLKEKMPWGIEVPGDNNQVMYVWFDALVNYISTLGWPSCVGESDGLDLFEKYWINGNPTQYCGKDNTRFQSAMWQAMLMAADLPNSHQIVVNGFITGEGGIRMSKTLGNVIDPREIVMEYGTDALRYFLLREVGSFEDSPFTLERFKDAYNSGLANGLGNLVSRVLKMATSNDIRVKQLSTYQEAIDSDINDSVRFCDLMEKFDIKKALDLLWARMQIIDGTIQSVQPFKLLKSESLEDKEKGKLEIQNYLSEIYRISLLLESIIPEKALEIQGLIKDNMMPEEPLFLRRD